MLTLVYPHILIRLALQSILRTEDTKFEQFYFIEKKKTYFPILTDSLINAKKTNRISLFIETRKYKLILFKIDKI